MKRFTLLPLVALALTACGDGSDPISVAPVFAQGGSGNPHFLRADASIGNAAQLVVSFKEAGLGSNVQINYEMLADASAIYYCINGGQKNPNAANKTEVTAPISATGTFSSGKNGSIVNSLQAGPPGPGAFACPPGQQLRFGEVSYSNIELHDRSTPVAANVSPQALSRVDFVPES